MVFNWIERFKRCEGVDPYNSLARLYDHIMDHVDYESWADYIEKIFIRYGHNIHRIVDGGCGTGNMGIVLSNRGYEISGFDLSFEMVLSAKKKNDAIPFWKGDLRSFGLRKGWDVFLCLFDTIQYLKLDEIRMFFSEVNTVLNVGGLFIFDAVTEQHVLRNWADYTEYDRNKNWESVRRSWYDRKQQIQHTEFVINFFHERRKVQEHHTQNIYKLSELDKIASESGMVRLGYFHEFTFTPGNEESDRVHFVLKKRRS